MRPVTVLATTERPRRKGGAALFMEGGGERVKNANGRRVKNGLSDICRVAFAERRRPMERKNINTEDVEIQ